MFPPALDPTAAPAATYPAVLPKSPLAIPAANPIVPSAAAPSKAPGARLANLVAFFLKRSPLLLQ